MVQQFKGWSRRKEKTRKRKERREEARKSIQAMTEKCRNVKVKWYPF